MKNLFLFLAVCSIALTSCSNDDDSNSTSSAMSAKINGTQKTFNVIDVEEVAISETETYLTVTAVNSSNLDESITFYTVKGETGEDIMFNFQYINGSDYYYDEGSFNSNLQTNNSDNKLKGTFSGTLSDAETVTVTNGSFNINY